MPKCLYGDITCIYYILYTVLKEIVTCIKKLVIPTVLKYMVYTVYNLYFTLSSKR